MTDFKIGDKVRIIAAEGTERYKNGDILTVSDTTPYELDSPHVFVTCADGKREMAYLREIEPYTPDVITINRADLPEITQKSDWLMDGDWAIGGAHMDASTASQAALRYLAAAEYLEARDKAAEEAIHKRDERRADLGCLSRTALIECIIDLEASHD